MQGVYDGAPMYSSYYIEVLIDEDKRIRGICRYLDELAFSNFPRTIFPAVFEAEAEEILNACTALPEN